MRAQLPYMAMLRLHALGLAPPSPALPRKLYHCALLQENVFFSRVRESLFCLAFLKEARAEAEMDGVAFSQPAKEKKTIFGTMALHVRLFTYKGPV